MTCRHWLAALALSALPMAADGAKVSDRAATWDPARIVPLAEGVSLPKPQELEARGALAIIDTGRTWGPTLGGERPQGWLSDAGLGLRFGNSRSGLGSVVHVDFSSALDPIPGSDRFQVVFETKQGF